MARTDRRTFVKHTAGSLAAAAILPDLGLANLPRGRAQVPVAVIGVGRWGRAILGELQKFDQAKIAALCDADRGRLDAGLRRAAGAEGFTDHRALLDKRPDIEAVVIATPTHLHRDIAQACVQAGRHVYLEAPIASTIEDCRAIAQAARGSAKVFHVGLLARSNPIYKLARSFYLSDAVRDLVGMRAQSNQKTTWRTPASSPEQERALNWHLDPAVSLGLAGEMGTHQFDVFHWYTGRYPTRVRATGAIRSHNDGRAVHDTIWAALAWEDGATLLYEATVANSFEGRHEVLFGSNATIKLAWTAGWMFKEADAPTQGWEVYANRQQFHNDEGITLIAEATKLAAQGKLKEGVGLPNPPLYYGLADFLVSVTEGKPPACAADEGLRATAVAIACHRAVATGEEVAIDQGLLKGT